jgi:hypothetical protein
MSINLNAMADRAFPAYAVPSDGVLESREPDARDRTKQPLCGAGGTPPVL